MEMPHILTGERADMHGDPEFFHGMVADFPLNQPKRNRDVFLAPQDTHFIGRPAAGRYHHLMERIRREFVFDEKPLPALKRCKYLPLARAERTGRRIHFYFFLPGPTQLDFIPRPTSNASHPVRPFIENRTAHVPLLAIDFQSQIQISAEYTSLFCYCQFDIYIIWWKYYQRFTMFIKQQTKVSRNAYRRNAGARLFAHGIRLHRTKSVEGPESRGRTKHGHAPRRDDGFFHKP